MVSLPEKTPQYVQVLRSIDKFDKIGRAGVVELLQKPIEEFGADVDPLRAELVGQFLDIAAAKQSDVIPELLKFARHAVRVRCRIDLMCLLEETVIDASGGTLWDQLLNMPQNADETWSSNGRPANIGWALDDMVEALAISRKGEGDAK